MNHICECDKINWSEKYKENYIHDDSKCKCCYSKFNRNEITYDIFKKSCVLCQECNTGGKSKKFKWIYDPCTW